MHAAGPGGAPRPVAPTPRAQLARAALEKRARTRLSAAVVLFVFYPGGYLKHENTPSYIKQTKNVFKCPAWASAQPMYYVVYSL